MNKGPNLALLLKDGVQLPANFMDWKPEQQLQFARENSKRKLGNEKQETALVENLKKAAIASNPEAAAKDPATLRKQEIDKIKNEAQALFKLGTQDAKQKLKAMQTQYTKEMNDFRKSKLDPVENEIHNLQGQIDKINNDAKELASKNEEKLNALQEKIRNYNETIKTTSNEERRRIMEEQLKAFKTEEKTLSEPPKINSQLKPLENTLANKKKVLNSLEEERKHIRNKQSAIPSAAQPLKKASANAGLEKDIIQEWLNKLSSVDIDNLANFLKLGKDDENEYTINKMSSIFSGFSKQDATFDEQKILQIAAGYLERQKGSYCKNHLDLKKALEGIIENKKLESAVQELSEKIHAKPPEQPKVAVRQQPNEQSDVLPEEELPMRSIQPKVAKEEPKPEQQERRKSVTHQYKRESISVEKPVSQQKINIKSPQAQLEMLVLDSLSRINVQQLFDKAGDAKSSQRSSRISEIQNLQNAIDLARLTISSKKEGDSNAFPDALKKLKTNIDNLNTQLGQEWNVRGESRMKKVVTQLKAQVDDMDSNLSKLGNAKRKSHK